MGVSKHRPKVASVGPNVKRFQRESWKSSIYRALNEPIQARIGRLQTQPQKFKHLFLDFNRHQRLFHNTAIKAVKSLSSDKAMYANMRIKGSANSWHSEILVDLMR